MPVRFFIAERCHSLPHLAHLHALFASSHTSRLSTTQTSSPIIKDPKGNPNVRQNSDQSQTDNIIILLLNLTTC